MPLVTFTWEKVRISQNPFHSGPMQMKAFILPISKYSFPVLTAVFALLYFTREDIYQQVIQENNYVEWLTFLFLLASAAVSLRIAKAIKTKYGYWHWFFILFSGFNVLAALEEISWGQHIFGWETTGVFAEYSDQRETNLHNTMQGIFKVKTKHIALLVLFVYGVLLPWLRAEKKLNSTWITNHWFVIPPTFLCGGFFIATLLMLDLPTGREEEIGEFFYSLCFLLMTLYQDQLVRHTTIYA